MAHAPKAMVEPSVLHWLREAAGLSVEEIAGRLRTKPENLAAWEQAGGGCPSMPQLRKLAKAYKRPISHFFLPAPAAEPTAPHDFRRLPEAGGGAYSPALRHELRAAHSRRALALDLLRESGREVPAVAAVGAASIHDDPEQVGQRLRGMIELSFGEQSRWRDSRAAYNNWRARVEGLGVLVFQITTVGMPEMLGFSIAERELPIIGINRKNQLNGRTFTLLHEFAHLMLAEGGSLCDMDDDLPRGPRERAAEVFCNHVAGAALVPRGELMSHPQLAGGEASSRNWSEAALASLARDFGVGEEVILRRLLSCRLTTREFYARKRAEYQSRGARSPKLEGARADGGFRRNMAQDAVANLGSFARIVLNSYHEDIINLSEAARHLGLRAEKVAAAANLAR